MKTSMQELSCYQQLPQGMLQCEAWQLHEVLPGPSMIFLPGRQPEYLFISVLLHGNETTGWDALRQLLSEYKERELPRALCLFIGNVPAAREGVRHLDGQPDYNRIWKEDGTEAVHPLAKQVLARLDSLDLFAAIDVHNNSGKNPHYACVNRLEKHYLHLASLFSRTLVYFIKPDTVMSMAMAQRCPAVTVECGQPGQPQGVAHVLNFLETCLNLEAFPRHSDAAQELDIFHTVATVKIPHGVQIGFGDEEVDCNLLPDIDRFNFCELPIGTALGQVRDPGVHPFEVLDEKGQHVTARYFEIKDRWILIRTPVMPSMLTPDLDIIRQDCLCYLMKRMVIQ